MDGGEEARQGRKEERRQGGRRSEEARHGGRRKGGSALRTKLKRVAGATRVDLKTILFMNRATAVRLCFARQGCVLRGRSKTAQRHTGGAERAETWPRVTNMKSRGWPMAVWCWRGVFARLAKKKRRLGTPVC